MLFSYCTQSQFLMYRITEISIWETELEEIGVQQFDKYDIHGRFRTLSQI